MNVSRNTFQIQAGYLFFLFAMGDRIHTAILQFLLTHGYKETQEAFVKEAGEFIDFESVEDVPPLDGTFSDALNQVTRNVASMSLERLAKVPSYRT